MEGIRCLVGVFLLFIAALNAENVCREKECVEIAEDFRANMDTRLDPCDDFYNFVCAKYPARHPIPDDKSAVNRMSELGDLVNQQIKNVLEEPVTANDPKHFVNLKKYYKACMNTDEIERVGLKEMKLLTTSLGGWPVIKDLYPATTWEKVVYRLRDFGFKASNLIKIDSVVDMKDTSVWLLQIGNAELGVDAAYLLDGRDNPIVEKYYDAMVNFVKLFGATEEQAKKEMSDVVDFETSLAEAMDTAENEPSGFEAIYNIYTLESLKRNFSAFPWDDHFEHFLPESVKLADSTRVVVTKPKYINKLINLLEKTDKKIMRNYLIFQALWSMAPYLNNDVRALSHKFKAAISGQKTQSARADECLESVLTNFLPVASALYVQRYANDQTKELATEMMLGLQEEYIAILGETNWPEGDKRAGIEKIRNYYAHVAYPKELKDNRVLAALYGEVDVNENEYLDSTLSLNKNANNIKWRQFIYHVNRSSWTNFDNAAVVNAYYKVDLNIIVLPAAILQGIYFNKNRPRYVNYAAAGTIIGHEMSHGFDSTGHQFDKDGKLNNWQSPEGAARYQEKEQCIVQQYNKFSIYGEEVNGQLSSGENMADFGGWKAAYRSYRKWEGKNGPEPGLPGLNYTNHQLFWITSGNIWCENERREATISSLSSDPHAPGRFRVNGALSNLKMFAEDFGCPVGSGMNPVNRCTPW